MSSARTPVCLGRTPPQTTVVKAAPSPTGSKELYGRVGAIRKPPKLSSTVARVDRLRVNRPRARVRGGGGGGAAEGGGLAAWGGGGREVGASPDAKLGSAAADLTGLIDFTA